MYYIYNVKTPNETFVFPSNRPAIFEDEDKEKAKTMCDLANLMSNTEKYAVGFKEN